MNIQNSKIVNQIQSVLHQLTLLEKKNIFNFEELKLFPSEIHLLLLIKEKQATNATIISKMLGLTKGAISQTLSRLEKKGVLWKTKDPLNKNELTLTFTSLGQQAIKHYEKQRNRILKQYDDYLAEISADERAAIEKFLLKMEAVMNDMR